MRDIPSRSTHTGHRERIGHQDHCGGFESSAEVVQCSVALVHDVSKFYDGGAMTVPTRPAFCGSSSKLYARQSLGLGIEASRPQDMLPQVRVHIIRSHTRGRITSSCAVSSRWVRFFPLCRSSGHTAAYRHKSNDFKQSTKEGARK